MTDVVAGCRAVVADLRARGVEVVEVPGWETRGRGAMPGVAGQVNHHDAFRASSGHAGGLRTCTFGRPDLRNSLCMWYLSSKPAVYLVAAGVSWHAGRGVLASNTWWGGIEARYHPDDGPWPAEQLRVYDELNAACVRQWGYPVANVVDHKEHAPGRKIDRSNVDPGARRAAVARLVQGRRWVLPTLQRGDRNDYVRALKALLNEKCGWRLDATSNSYGPAMVRKVKDFQAFFQLAVDGVCGPQTWDTLLALPVR